MNEAKDTESPNDQGSASSQCSAAFLSELAGKLEQATTAVIESCNTNDEDIARLIQRSSEAVAVLRMHGEFNITRVMYDFVRTAAGGGWCPEDMDDRFRR